MDHLANFHLYFRNFFVLYLDYKDADLCLLLLSYNTSVLYKIVISIFMDMADSHANKYITSENVRNY